MTGAEITEICTTAVTIITLILGFLAQRRQGNVIHSAVNSTNTSLVRGAARTEQLTKAMTDANIPVPDSPPVVEGNET